MKATTRILLPKLNSNKKRELNIINIENRKILLLILDNIFIFLIVIALILLEK